MYTLKTAFCLSRNSNSRWEELDISTYSLQEIFLTYLKIFLVLESDVLEAPIYVDMDQFRHENAAMQSTLLDFLVELGDNSLETVASLPSSKVGKLSYSDARQAGYKVDVARAGFIDPVNYPSSDMDDLVIKHGEGKVEPETLMRNCIFSVNGLLHRSEMWGDNVYIIDGNKSGRTANKNNVGIHSFYDIGEVKQYSIDPETIRARDDLVLIKDKLFFTLPDGVAGKTFFLVLGGYLVFPEKGVFYEDGSGNVTLHLNKIPYIERIFESMDMLDLDSLDINKTEINPRAVHQPTLESEDCIKKYFSLSQTFLVTVDCDGISLEKTAIRHRSYPGSFTTMEEPRGGLIVGHGRFSEYIKIPCGDSWNLTVDDSFLRNYLVTGIRGITREHITDNLNPIVPAYESHGYMLTVTGYKSN